MRSVFDMFLTGFDVVMTGMSNAIELRTVGWLTAVIDHAKCFRYVPI